MKEILFRGKHIDTGEWVYGDVTHLVGGAQIWITDESDTTHSLAYNVDPATVGEYTGLKDKNGRRIFEGDVVRWDDDPDALWTIKYSPRYCRFEGYHTEMLCTVDFDDDGENFEVISNIHDNPELLEPEEVTT